VVAAAATAADSFRLLVSGAEVVRGGYGGCGRLAAPPLISKVVVVGSDTATNLALNDFLRSQI